MQNAISAMPQLDVQVGMTGSAMLDSAIDPVTIVVLVIVAVA